MVRGFARTFLACGVAVALLAGCGGKEERQAKYMERGKAFFMDENYDKARVEFKNVLQINPKTAEAHFYMAKIFESEAEWAKAFASYLRAVELNPDLYEARAKLGQFYLSQANAAKAAGDTVNEEKAVASLQEQLDAILAHKPDDLDALTLQASVYARSGRNDEAIKALRSIIQREPGDGNAVVLLSRLLEEEEKPDEALQVLLSGIDAAQDNVAMRMELVQLYGRRKDNEAAVAALRDLIRLKPEELGFRLTLAAYYARLDDLDQAESILRDAVQVDVTDPERHMALVQFLAARRGIDVAISELESAIAQQPGIIELHLALASYYREADQMDKAKNVLTSVIDKEKDNPKGLLAKVGLAELYASEENFGQVRKLTNEVLEVNPSDNEALKLRGRLDLKEGNLDEAVSAFRTVLRDQPDSVPILKLLAQAHVAKGEIELAGDQLRRAVELAPNNFDARLSYARFLLGRGSTQAAIEQVDAVLDTDPENIQALGTQVDIMLAKHDVSAVKEILEKLKQAAPESAEGNVRLAKLLLEENDLDGASREVDEALAKNPRHFGALLVKSDILAASKDVEGLKSVLKQLIEYYPDSPEGHFRMGRVYRIEKKNEQALAEYEKALERSSGRVEAMMLTEVINAQLAMGEAAAAKARLQRLLEEDPSHPVANNLLGMVYMTQKQFPEAEAAFEKQISINPNTNVVYSHLATARAAQENMEGAVEALESGLEKVPDDLRLLIALAGYEERLGNVTRSMDLYEQVLAKAPNNALATNNLAALLADHAETQEGLERAKSLADKLKNVSQPAFQDTVGWVYYRTGDTGRAIEILKPVVESAPDVGVFHYHLGMAMMKKGESAAAREHLTKAVELGGFEGLEQAREALANL